MVMWPYTWFDYSRPEGIESLIDTIEEMFFSGILKPGISWRSHCLGDHGIVSSESQGDQREKKVKTRTAAK
jgi:hypothetical protein